MCRAEITLLVAYSQVVRMQMEFEVALRFGQEYQASE
jgi:hypothetical protein